MSNETPELSIVIPVFNEQESLADLMDAIRTAMPSKSRSSKTKQHKFRFKQKENTMFRSQAIRLLTGALITLALSTGMALAVDKSQHMTSKFEGPKANTGTAIGQVFSLFVIAVAAAEVGVGLAIVLLIYRNRRSIDLDQLDEMKG